MTALSQSKINALARLLENETNVEFKHNAFYYEVFESANGGYVVNIYSSDDKDEDDEYIESNLVDGGLCSGTSIDAIEFML